MIPLLAIETSGELCSVALLKTEKNFYEVNIAEKNVHSEKLMLAVENLLELSETELKNLKAIAVSVGPGSFTGLRIGMSAAKGLAFGSGLPIVPVKTFHALALEISKYLPVNTVFIIANILNTTEIFFTKFKKKDDFGYDVITDVTVINKSEFEKYRNENEIVFGNYLENNTGIFLPVPSAKFVAEWAYIFGKDLLTYNFDYMEPDYIKKFIPRKGQ